MGSIYQICFDTIQEFMNKKAPFKFSELTDLVIKRGGILRVAPDISVSEYLESLLDREKGNGFYFNAYTKQYAFLDEEFVESLRKFDQNQDLDE